MNKKFLSAILFGALMVSSTGTFVSCKDYDDDIDQINSELSDIKSKLAALETKVESGKYVTNVTKDGEGILITWNDNSTNKIETIKGDKGDKGESVKITIDPTTKHWLIDGVDTGVCAEGKNGTAADGVSAKSPSIDPKTGNWIVYEWDAEKKEYVGKDTGISARGASAYVVDEGNYFILNVAANKEGSEYTTVKLPKTPVIITEAEVLGLLKKNLDGSAELDGTEIKYNYTYIADADPFKDWNKCEGVKKVVKGQVLSTLANAEFALRVAPAKLDASKFSFSFVNSLMKEAPIALNAPSAFEYLLTRATAENGLWVLKAAPVEGLTYEKANDYEKALNGIAFALKEKDGFMTSFDVEFSKDADIVLTTKVAYVNDKTAVGAKTAAYDKAGLQQLNDTELNVVNLGKVNITFTAPGAYDAHLHFDNATIQRWGITEIEGTSFKVTKRPDDVTSANFQVQVHYVTYKGEVKSEYVPFRVAKSYSNETTLAAKNIKINKTNALNTFANSLDLMFTNLGANVDLWKADVNSVAVTYQVQDPTSGVWSNASNFTAQLLKADGTIVVEGSTLKSDAKLNSVAQIKVALTSNTTKMMLDRSYRVAYHFLDVNNEVLNVVYQPITFSIPALSEFLVKEQVVFGGTNTGKAYMNVDDQDTKLYPETETQVGNVKIEACGKAGTSRYAFTHAFKNFADVCESVKFDFNVDDKQKLANGELMTNHAKVVRRLGKYAAVQLIPTSTDAKMAYHTPINIVITGATYLTVYEYSDEEKAANAFALDVMSPVKEGKVVPAEGTAISVVATDNGTAKLTESNFKATTYAGIAYHIFKDAEFNTDGKATKYASPYINAVNFKSANENVFKVDANGEVATKDSNGKVTEGYVVIKPANAGYEATEKVNVKVKDIWGYELDAPVNVTVKPHTGK